MTEQRHTTIDSETDQQARGYRHSEPCIFMSIVPSYPRHDIQPMIPAPGIVPYPETHYLPEPYESPMFYGVPHYYVIPHHHPNLDLGLATAPNFYSPYAFPYRPPSHLSPSSHYGNTNFMDTASGLQYPVETLRNPQNVNHPAASSFPFTPLNISDGASYSLPQFRGMDETPLMKVGMQRSVTNGLGLNPVTAHSRNNFDHGNYTGQSFQPLGALWFDQELSNGGNGGIPSPWYNPPSVPYMYGSDFACGFVKPGSINLQGYHHEWSSDRNFAAFAYPPPLNPGHQYVANHPSYHEMQGMRGNVYPVAQPRVPVNDTPQRTEREGLEIRSANVRPVRSNGPRINEDNRGRPRAEPIPRHLNLPRLRIMPVDEVALLDADSSDYGDHHRHMRLDIEDMSYEELLALSERIGTVNTMSEDKVSTHLNTRLYRPSDINLEEAPPLDQESDFCIICLEHYKNREKIGALSCGHEYHADCLKKWLVVKNVCPICKSEALVTEKKAA